jgi:hypothetical protein
MAAPTCGSASQAIDQRQKEKEKKKNIFVCA